MLGFFFLSQAEIYLQIEHLPLLSSHGIGVALLPELQERVDSAPRDARGGIVGAAQGQGLDSVISVGPFQLRVFRGSVAPFCIFEMVITSAVADAGSTVDSTVNAAPGMHGRKTVGASRCREREREEGMCTVLSLGPDSL